MREARWLLWSSLKISFPLPLLKMSENDIIAAHVWDTKRGYVFSFVCLSTVGGTHWSVVLWSLALCRGYPQTLGPRSFPKGTLVRHVAGGGVLLDRSKNTPRQNRGISSARQDRMYHCDWGSPLDRIGGTTWTRQCGTHLGQSRSWAICLLWTLRKTFMLKL